MQYTKDVPTLSIPVYSFSVKVKVGNKKQVKQWKHKYWFLLRSFFPLHNQITTKKKQFYTKWRQKRGLNKILRYKVIIHNSFSIHSFHIPPGKGLESIFFADFNKTSLIYNKTDEGGEGHREREIRKNRAINKGKDENRKVKFSRRMSLSSPCELEMNIEERNHIKVLVKEGKTKQYEILFHSGCQTSS